MTMRSAIIDPKPEVSKFIAAEEREEGVFYLKPHPDLVAQLDRIEQMLLQAKVEASAAYERGYKSGSESTNQSWLFALDETYDVGIAIDPETDGPMSVAKKLYEHYQHMKDERQKDERHYD